MSEITGYNEELRMHVSKTALLVTYLRTHPPPGLSNDDCGHG